MSEDDPLSRPSGREFGFGPIMVALLLLIAVGIAGVVGLIFLAPDLVEVSPGGTVIAHQF
ncbi:hypothetical protein DM826_00260 [Halonotius aquaticus]|jgi:hypothetical protein|uniref:Flagellin N-terminal-like domain-containing protein n=1 Tax=Halonotius aquaticus TaxID=2216978 RepID=A0A3A6Q6X4_9EURY|nr:hypothetical protein [Halonotius aquaticus]RJX45168.1 hypothetical protein DM826_00260 [Halonotius aquaticus]